MRHIARKAGRWDIALACGSLTLVMLVLTGVFHGQDQKPRTAASAMVQDAWP
jgi:hypothetical protein